MVKLNVKKVTKSNVMNEAILTPQKEARLHQNRISKVAQTKTLQETRAAIADCQ